MEDSTLAAADARIHIGVIRRALFADWRQSGDLTWGPTGRAIQTLYGFDPWKITGDSFEGYIARMHAHHKGLPRRCLISNMAAGPKQLSGLVTAPPAGSVAGATGSPVGHLEPAS